MATTNDERVIAEALFQQAQLARDVLIAMHDGLLDRPIAGSERLRAIREAQYRATLWSVSIGKMNHANDVQAIHAGARTLAEIAVDMALLHADKTEASATKLVAYEWEQKLTAAHKYRDYARERGATPEFQPLIDFLHMPKAVAVEHERSTHWPTKNGKTRDRAPQTWTGNDALANARHADAVGCSCWTRVGSLYQQYAEQNSRLNWGTHGSGAVLFRGVSSSMDALYAVALREAIAGFAVCIGITICEFPSVCDLPKVHAATALLRAHAESLPMLNQ